MGLRSRSRGFRLAALVLGALALAGCETTLERLANIGKEPELGSIEDPTGRPDYRPVALPMPWPEADVWRPNSLWRAGARTFFRDQRANRVGDILTVTIEIEDKAEVRNTTTHQRTNDTDAGITNFFGYEDSLNRVLPQGVDPANLISIDSDTELKGKGEISRNETISLRVAAVITQVLPNGNLVIHGVQEMRVNFEVRVLSVAGIVRPEDIDSNNEIRHDQIAEARISYGGRGQITELQQPRYGQQVFDIVYPF